MKLNRRDFVKIAAAGIATPWLGVHNLARAETTTDAKRVLIFVDQYGRHGPRTSSTITAKAPWITDEGGDYDLTEDNLGWILEPVAHHIEDLSVLSGIPLRSRQVLGGGISHAQVNAYTLTASRVSGNIRSASTICAHPSIHNVIGNELNASSTNMTPYNSLSLGGNPYSYGDDGRRQASISTPTDIYDRLFGLEDARIPLESQKLVAEQVRNQLSVIAPELVQANASTVLDAYHSSIDSIAQELQLRADNQCGVVTPGGLAQNNAGETAVPQLFDSVYDIFSCGLTSSVALAYNGNRHGYLDASDFIGNAANNLLSNRNHHNLSHQKNDNAGAAQGVVMQYQVQEIARLADRLKLTPELDGSGDMMMDNTVIFYHQAMAAPTHLTTVPYYHFMLAGRNTNVVRGKHFECSEHTDNEMWTTLAQAVGVPLTRFGGYQGNTYKGNQLNTGPISKVLKETMGA